MQARMVIQRPACESTARRSNDRANSGDFDGHFQGIRTIRYSQQRQEVDTLDQGNLRQYVEQVGNFQIALVVQQRHMLFEEGKVDQIVAFETFIVSGEFDQNIIDI